MEEIWKGIKDYSKYEVSNLGRVRNIKTGRILKPNFSGRYYSVELFNETGSKRKNIHRLVAEAFVERKNGQDVVNHIDGNSFNNSASNLEWCTVTENNIHAVKNGLNRPGAYQNRPIRIKETGEIIYGVTECANHIGADFRNVYRSLNSPQNYAVNGYHLEYADKAPFLYDYQEKAVKNMKNGCILNGGVGSGKSRTGLYYYFSKCGGKIDAYNYTPMTNPKNLLILTTAMKRDKHEWDKELIPFLLSTDPEINYYSNEVIIDSWNNIKKYADLKNWFVIFDEDRVTGSGVWVKVFLRMAKNNEWIILSATPGDTWSDYIPVFIANGFYRNRSDFSQQHIVYARYCTFPKIDRYINTRKLVRLRERVLVDMEFHRKTKAEHTWCYCDYDISAYKQAMKTRWDPYKDEPIQNAGGLCYVLRRIVNSDESRLDELRRLLTSHPKVIVFYNFDYEREELIGSLRLLRYPYSEWSGHAHQEIPDDGHRWVYLVQYTAGCEGWNSIKTDTVIFFSQNYSYKVMEQAAGRIDRLNTPYDTLYFYHFTSRSPIDRAITNAVKTKKIFNERRFVKW